MRRFLIASLIPLAAVACGDGLSGPSGSGDAQILLARAPGASASLAASVASNGGAVDFAEIASLELIIDRVEVHASSEEEEESEEGGWLSLDIEPVTVDLAAIGEGTVAGVGAGTLPAGTYNQVRFFLSSSTIAFVADVTVGQETFLAGQVYELDIPSSQNTGLKVQTQHFTVGEGEETVLVLFDPAGTSATIVATGSGKVIMSPVLREAPEVEEAEADAG